MRNINLKINKAIISVISATALASFIFVGASFAQPHIASVKKTNHNLAHYTKVTGEDTGHYTKVAGKDTAHYTKVAGKKTGRFFRRVGHAIY